ncbi:ABC transporter permease [Aquamicrobium defluvii]|uniref:Glycine/betaine ABC transporter n=1 Tax=Aquamicrobium defluvii TaxID=69279 RepID=A0A011TLM0_9HYPH|nr:ABC transporter permease subunit [Aquamicrobium defluvii]EXL04927.1 glycine/betaine ABC transporter [Aquamicrobium defluvii]EZQ14557.1 glycine/betaine ABC transporter [Halopseudomonas bauzanensis]
MQPENFPGKPDVPEFTGINGEYYRHEFHRIEEGNASGISFNYMAALLGPLWLGVRNLWSYFWIALILELISLVQLSRGLWGNIGAEEFARARAIAQRAAQRADQAAAALAENKDNFQALNQAAKNLKEEAANALALAQSLSDGAVRYLVAGTIGFLAVRIVIGLMSNRALERRYMQWRADRSIAHGFNWFRSALLSLLLGAVYFLTLLRFSTAEAPKILYQFPTNQELITGTTLKLDNLFTAITATGAPFFNAITNGLRVALDGIEMILVGTPWIVVFALTSLMALRAGGAWVAIFTMAALAYLGVFGFWEKSMVTVSLLGTAALLCIVIGIPLGILCGKRARFYKLVKPFLDLMQTMPAFVYLIPVIAFFGIGRPPGVVATFIFGMPPVVRLTALGIQGVPESVKEATTAFGASKWFLLFKVEIPLAMPSIMTGVNQTILMCLSMVVLASLIGAKGLGEDVLVALQYAAEGQGILAGVAILFCAMILDRIIQGRNTSKNI